MPDDTRDRTGPLSERQRLILQRLAEGQTLLQIGAEISLSKNHVGRIVNNSLVPKLRVRRTSQAIALYGRHKGLIDAAQHLKAGLIAHPIDEAEVHVNHVLEALAAKLTSMANNLLP